MSGRRVVSGLALGLLLSVLQAGSAGAANWLEQNFYLSGPRFDGRLPPCDHPSALARIASRFGTKEGRFWNSSLAIEGFENIHETGFRTWAANSIPRRFCTAIAHVSDGQKHLMHYSIGEDTGFIGASWGVEWCVVGLDRNWAYNPACKMARP